MEKLQVRSTSAIVGLFSRIGTTEGREIPEAALRKGPVADVLTESVSDSSSTDKAANLESART
jgi:hypothetical protein